jgi:hypothetical protein
MYDVWLHYPLNTYIYLVGARSDCHGDCFPCAGLLVTRPPYQNITTPSAATSQNYTPSRYLSKASSSDIALPNAHMADDPARVDVIVPTQRDIPTDGTLAATSSNAPSRHLPRASSSDMAFPGAHMAGATADTDLVVPTQLDISTASALSTSSDALEHSPLRRLPRELRDKIYSMIFTQPHGLVCRFFSWSPSHDGTPVSQALNIRATCKQIHAETESMFFVLNDISIDLLRLGDQHKTSTKEEWGMRNTHFVNTIPPRLLSPSTKVIVWVPSACADSSDMSQVICRLVQSVQHGNLFLGARLGNPRWVTLDSVFQLVPVLFPDRPVCLKEVPIGDRPVCKDVTVSMNDCTGFEIVFPFNDRAAVLAVVEDQYSNKIALIEVHMTHWWCSVRAQRESLFQSLDLAREKFLRLVATTFEALESMKQWNEVILHLMGVHCPFFDCADGNSLRIG